MEFYFIFAVMAIIAMGAMGYFIGHHGKKEYVESYARQLDSQKEGYEKLLSSLKEGYENQIRKWMDHLKNGTPLKKPDNSSEDNSDKK